MTPQELDLLAFSIREKRNQMLNEIDIIYCNAEAWSKMSEEEKEVWSYIKHQLRDIPDQEGFPTDVVFPEY